VAPSALRPTGPPAAEASAPILVLITQQLLRAPCVHDQQDEVCGLAAKLEARLMPSTVNIEGASQGPLPPRLQINAPRP